MQSHEMKIQGQKEAMKREAEKFRKAKCNDKGEIEEGNLTKEEKEGKNRIKKRIKSGEIFVTLTEVCDYNS
jgi:hypothetical protein